MKFSKVDEKNNERGTITAWTAGRIKQKKLKT